MENLPSGTLSATTTSQAITPTDFCGTEKGVWELDPSGPK